MWSATPAWSVVTKRACPENLYYSYTTTQQHAVVTPTPTLTCRISVVTGWPRPDSGVNWIRYPLTGPPATVHLNRIELVVSSVNFRSAGPLKAAEKAGRRWREFIYVVKDTQDDEFVSEYRHSNRSHRTQNRHVETAWAAECWDP